MLNAPKILVITPIYKISGRNNLFHDSSAVHYLLKYWPNKDNLRVVFTYFNSFKSVFRYVQRKERLFHRDGYRYELDDIKVYMIETQLLPFISTMNTIQRKRIVRQVKEFLKTEHFIPDIIVSHIPTYKSVTFINDLMCKKKVAILHETDKTNVLRNKKVLRLLESSFDEFYTRSFALNRFFASIGIAKLQNEVILSGVSANGLPSISINRSFAFNDAQRFIYVGKLIKRKNVRLILEWIKKFDKKRTAKLTIIGTGSEEKSLKRYASINNLSDRVRFLGHVNHSKIYSFFDENDIFLMPSIKETFGLVYLEAMSRGCICIGTKNEGIDGVIVDKTNGLLIDPTIESLNEQLQFLFSCNEETLRKISENGFRTSRKMNEQKMGTTYYEIIVNN